MVLVEPLHSPGDQKFDFDDHLATIYQTLLVPMLFEPFAEHMVEYAARSPPAHILELSAGTGALTRALLSRMPTAEIVATDISPAMIAEGRRTMEGSGVHWLEADAGKLPFGPDMFDLVVAQFGVMFYPDKTAAFREAARVLRPNGRFLFSTWGWLQDNDFARTVDEGLGRLFPSDPPSFLRRLPYAYYDEEIIRAQMSAAGFSIISCDHMELTSTAESAGLLATAFCEGTPLRAEIAERAPDRFPEFVAAVARIITAKFGSMPVGSMSALFVMGTAH